MTQRDSRDHSEGHCERRESDGELTMGVIWEGARVLSAGVNDQKAMVEGNWAAELAIRVYRAMRREEAREAVLATTQARE